MKKTLLKQRFSLRLSLRTRLTLAVVLLLLLAFAAVGSAWFVQEQSKATVARLNSIGVEANSYAKNAFIYAQQAATQVDGAIGIANEKQRLWELGQADELLQRSRASIESLEQSGAFTGSEGESLLHILLTTYKDYWAQVEGLRELVAKQDVPAFDALKRGRLRNAARGMDRAFNQLDQYVYKNSAASSAELVELFHWSNYGHIALVAVALLLAIIIYLMLMRTVLRPLVGVGHHLKRVAAGNLGSYISVRSSDEIGVLFSGLKSMQGSLRSMISGVREHMQQMTGRARGIAAGNLDLSSRTDQQAAALQETAASLEQLASTVRQNADNAQQANQLANSASAVASRGGTVVGEVVQTMQGISGSSQKIADIVGVIDSIAFQTNILALNAAVEAARAGEQGRGFAVVASEVRALAQRSAGAAHEIKTLIDDSVERVSLGSSQVERAGQTMQEIVEAVTRVSDIMSEISAASSEQSSGIDQINLAVSQMDSVTQQNAQLVQQAAESASELDRLAQEVYDSLSVFNFEGDDDYRPYGASAPASAPASGAEAPGQTGFAGGAARGSAASLPAPKAAAAKAPLQAQQNRRATNTNGEAGHTASATTPARKSSKHAPAPARAGSNGNSSPGARNAQAAPATGPGSTLKTGQDTQAPGRPAAQGAPASGTSPLSPALPARQQPSRNAPQQTGAGSGAVRDNPVSENDDWEEF